MHINTVLSYISFTIHFATKPRDLDKMPVKSPVKPKDKDVLRSKILAAEPSDEGLRVIMAAVKYQVSSSYEYRSNYANTLLL